MTLKSVSIVLKIVELFLLLAAAARVGHFVKGYHKSLAKVDPEINPTNLGVLGRFEFFLYTTAVGAIIAVVALSALLTGLHEENGGTLAMVAVHALWTLQLLASSALLAKVLDGFKREEIVRIDSKSKTSYCEIFDDQDKDYTCIHIKDGVVSQSGSRITIDDRLKEIWITQKLSFPVWTANLATS